MLTPAQVMAQVIKFLSLSTDLKAMEIRLPGTKINQIRAEARKLE